MADEIIEELWRIKDEIAREHGYDVRRLGAYYQRRERQKARREEKRTDETGDLCQRKSEKGDTVTTDSAECVSATAHRSRS